MSRASLRSRAAELIPAGTATTGLGVAMNGLATYAFLVLPARSGRLDAGQYASFTRLWFLVFVLAPGLFLPIEQELARAVASRRGQGLGVGPLVRATAAWAAIAAGVGLALATGVGLVFSERLLGGQRGLVVALMVTVPTYALLHLLRGLLSGDHAFGAYGATFAGEGLIRLAIAVALVIAGVTAAGPYGLAIAATPILAVSVGLLVKRPDLDDGPPAAHREIGSAFGLLLAAQLSSALLANSAPLAFGLLGGADREASALAAGLILTRVPLFGYQAVQAALIPQLARLVAEGDLAAFVSLWRTLMATLAAGLALVTVIAGLGGSWVVELAFGSDFALSGFRLASLAAGSGLFVLGLAATQALLALRERRSMVLSWAVGLAVTVALLLVPVSDLDRVIVAFVGGTGASVVAAVALVRIKLGARNRI